MESILVNKFKADLKDKILLEMKNQEVSQVDIAKKMNVSKSAINNYLNSNFDKVTINKLLEICEALKIECFVSFN